MSNMRTCNIEPQPCKSCQDYTFEQAQQALRPEGAACTPCDCGCEQEVPVNGWCSSECDDECSARDHCNLVNDPHCDCSSCAQHNLDEFPSKADDE